MILEDLIIRSLNHSPALFNAYKFKTKIKLNGKPSKY